MQALYITFAVISFILQYMHTMPMTFIDQLSMHTLKNVLNNKYSHAIQFLKFMLRNLTQ